jgi:hypothetical protein
MLKSHTKNSVRMARFLLNACNTHLAKRIIRGVDDISESDTFEVLPRMIGQTRAMVGLGTELSKNRH